MHRVMIDECIVYYHGNIIDWIYDDRSLVKLVELTNAQLITKNF
ncbi:MAG: hypothetical protein ACTTIC_00145 [Helicobacteraceae bacterium]